VLLYLSAVCFYLWSRPSQAFSLLAQIEEVAPNTSANCDPTLWGAKFHTFVGLTACSVPSFGQFIALSIPSPFCRPTSTPPQLHSCRQPFTPRFSPMRHWAYCPQLECQMTKAHRADSPAALILWQHPNLPFSS